MSAVVLVLLVAFLIRLFVTRNVARLGGKLGWRRAIDDAIPFADGFSHAYARDMTIYTASADAADFSSLKAFLRHGTVGQPVPMQVFRVAGCRTEVEIPAAAPDYQRLDAAQALALLRELPDLRLVRRLQLSDQRSFLDPWVHKRIGPDYFVLGNATNFRLIVLYRPDRRMESTVSSTLLHEWLHLVAFESWTTVWRFRLAGIIEPTPPLALEPIAVHIRKPAVYETWCELGEKLFGRDETIARDAALALPVHAMIVWRRVEKMLRSAPPRWRSSRFAELDARGAFMRGEVAPRARAAWTGGLPRLRSWRRR
jgi:hypothetical protein